MFKQLLTLICLLPIMVHCTNNTPKHDKTSSELAVYIKKEIDEQQAPTNEENVELNMSNDTTAPSQTTNKVTLNDIEEEPKTCIKRHGKHAFFSSLCGYGLGIAIYLIFYGIPK